MLRTTERRLIRKANAGDGAAIDALIRAHQSSLYAYMLRLSGRPEIAEDVVQEAFIRVIGNLHRFDDRFRFSTWVYTIARRLYVNQMQKLQPRYDSDAVGGWQDREESGSPGARTMRDESMTSLRRLLDAALQELPLVPREIVILFHQQGWGIGAIAEHMNLPEGTVKSHLHRARKRMQKSMLDQAPDAGTIMERCR